MDSLFSLQVTSVVPDAHVHVLAVLRGLLLVIVTAAWLRSGSRGMGLWIGWAAAGFGAAVWTLGVPPEARAAAGWVPPELLHPLALEITADLFFYLGFFVVASEWIVGGAAPAPAAARADDDADEPTREELLGAAFQKAVAGLSWGSTPPKSGAEG